MMTAAWALAFAALTTLLGGCIGSLWRGGRREGKVDAVLEQLTRITADHENRIRAQERRRRRI
jgi:hypothetical protein